MSLGTRETQAPPAQEHPHEMDARSPLAFAFDDNAGTRVETFCNGESARTREQKKLRLKPEMRALLERTAIQRNLTDSEYVEALVRRDCGLPETQQIGAISAVAAAFASLRSGVHAAAQALIDAVYVLRTEGYESHAVADVQQRAEAVSVAIAGALAREEAVIARLYERMQ